MPDPSGLMPPYFDPSQYPAYLDATKKQMLAQMLMGTAQQANQTPSDWNSMRVVPRRSALQNVTGLLSSALAGKAMGSSMQAQQKYMTGLMGGQPQGDQGAAPAAADPNAQGSDPNATGAAPQQPQSPFLPPGMSPRVAQGYLQMMGPEKFAEMAASQYKPTPEWLNALRATGGDHRAAAQLMLAKATKEGTIDFRPGGMAKLPNGQIIRNPQLATGEEPITDADGNVIGTRMLPGHLPNVAALEKAETGAKEEAKAPYEMVEVPLGGGRTAKMPLSEYMKRLGIGEQAPTGSPGAPANPKYFGSPAPQGPQAPQEEWLKGAPKVPVPNTFGQTSDAYHQKILEHAASKHVELADKYGSEADLADARTAFNNEALKVLSGADTGPLSDALTKLRAKALEAHVPASWIPGADTVQNTQELKKFLLRNPLLSLKPTFGGRPAAAEFQVLANDASPSPLMLKSAIKRLVELDNTQAGYAKQRAEDYGKYQAAGGDPFRFESYYAKTHPFAKALDGNAAPPTNQAPAQAIEHLKQHPELKDAFRSKYGYLPNGF